MRICDLKPEQIKLGIRVKSLVMDKWGTVIAVHLDDDCWCEVQWDGDTKPMSGFYGNDCEMECEPSSV